MRQNTLDQTWTPVDAAYKRIEDFKDKAFSAFLTAVSEANPKLAKSITSDLSMLSAQGFLDDSSDV